MNENMTGTQEQIGEPAVENVAAETAAEPVAEPAAEPVTEITAEAPAAEVAEGTAAEVAPSAPAAKGGKRSKTKRAKGGKAKGKHRKLKCVIAVVAALALCGTGLGIGLMFIPKEGRAVNTGYASVSYEVQEGELFSPSAEYTGLDIFGRLNWTFQQKTEWYSAYEGHVYTTVNQDVWTYKQFKDGRLISADISKSSLVNLAREFCYIPPQNEEDLGRVIWREASGGPATYNGFDTPWQTGAPKGNMSIEGPDGFKAKNGLPATELIGYIFREDTVDHADPVVDNGDGTYTITYYMNPEVWQAEDGTAEGAAAYYANQMKFTGGLTDVPTFETITISFTFNEKWENLKTEIHEDYVATMGFTVGCTAVGVTEYSYDTPYLPLSNAYEEYFKEYASMAPTGAPDPTIDGMGALTSAFAPVLSGPTTLSVDLNVGERAVNGVVYVDLHTGGGVPSFNTAEDITNFVKNLEVRAKIGNVNLWLEGGAAYVQAGDMKVKLTATEFTGLLAGLLGGSGEEAEAQPAADVSETEESDIFSDLLNGEFTYESGADHANMHSVITISGVTIPLDFNYFVEPETLAVSLDNVHTQFSVEGIGLAATLGYTSADQAPAPLEDRTGFPELADHIKNIIALIKGGNLHAEVSYQGYGMEVEGKVDFSFAKKADGELTDEQKKEKIKVNALLTVTHGGAEKVVGIAYEKGIAYLTLDGVKLSADVNEAAALVMKYLSKDENGQDGAGAEGGTESSFSLSNLIDTLLFTPVLTQNITISGDDTSVAIAIKAGKLVQALGFSLGSFDLGTVELGADKEQFTVGALGARLALSAGKDFALETDGYTDVMRFAGAVSALLDGGFIKAEVGYKTDKLEVGGTLQVDLGALITEGDASTVAAEGQFNLKYGQIDKTVTIAYAQNGIYLTVEGLKLKVSAKEGVDILMSILFPKEADAPADGEASPKTDEDAPKTDEEKAEEILDLLFSFRFDKILQLQEDENNTLTLTLKGTELLKVFDVEFALGDVTLSVDEAGALKAKALGVDVALAKGTKFTPVTEGFTDLTPVLEKLPALLSEKAVSVQGELTLTVGKTEGEKEPTAVTLAVREGVVSWKEGLNVYLRIALVLGETEQEILLRVTGTEVQFAYGNIGAQLYYSDLSQLETALLKVYDKVRGIVAQTLGAEAKNPLPELKSFNDLIDLLKGSAALADATETAVGETSKFDWTELVQNLEIDASGLTGGIARLAYKGLTVDLLSELAEDGFLGLKLGFTADGVQVTGGLHAGIFTGTIPAMPTLNYLGAEDMADLIDYLGAAVSLVAQNNLKVTISGTVKSTEEKYLATDGIKYKIAGGIEYLSGGTFPLSLDLEGKNLVVSPDVALHVSFRMAAQAADENNLEFDIIVADYDDNDMLDFFISASTVGTDDEGTGKTGYDPLKLYAPADEVMTLLSGVCVMFGFDEDVLNNFVIFKWLPQMETVGQLKALGVSLRTMLANITGVGPILEKLGAAADFVNGLDESIGSLFGGKDKANADADAPAAMAETGASGVITALELSRATADQKGSFTFSVDAGLLTDGEGAKDLKVTLEKRLEEDGSTLLTSLAVENIYNKKGTEETSVTVGIDTADVTVATPTALDDYFNVEAVHTLILALAKSATHGVNEDGTLYTGEETPPRYLLNNNFYINGSATLNLLGDATQINIRVIALSVNLGEDGSVGVNVRLEYDGLHMALAGLLGDSDIIKGDTTLDVTIKASPRAGEGIMLYMRRMQTSEFRGALGTETELPAPIVIYRALPLSNFMKNYMEHICFMFNLSTEVMNKIMGMVGGSGDSGSGGGETETAPTDLGAYLDKFVSSCTYDKAGTGDKWTLNVNGERLTGSTAFKKMEISVTTDGEGYLRTITAALNIADAVNINANLRWCNPGFKMDEGVTDITTDVAETLESAMDVKLKSADWNTTDYLEGQITTVTYWIDGVQIGHQDVIFNPATGESFAKLVTPDLTKYFGNMPGYTPVWDLPEGGKVSADLRIDAKYRPNTYHLVFKSAEQIKGADGYDEEYVEGENVWLYKKDWTFGTAIELPFAETEEKEITYFKCAHGHEYFPGGDLTLHVYTDETITFTANWEYIEYKVEFVADGKVYETKTGHYGTQVSAPDKNPDKTGYTFQEWSGKPETFTSRDTVQVNAVFAPNTYTVTILSDYEMPEGTFGKEFEAAEKVGEKFAWTLTFTYDVKYALPQNIRVEHYILHGFKTADDDTLYYDYLPNVLDATTFTAVWEELGVDVYFEGVTEPFNRKIGSQIARSEMPAVPEQKGYTGAWDFVGDSYTVPETGDGEDGKIVIKPKYTPITYVIYGLSRFNIDGFEHVSKTFDSEGVTGNEFYYTRYEYVYGTHPGPDGGYHLREGLSESQVRYDFAGWYTTRFGTSNHGEATKVEYINDSVIENVFHFNVGDGNDRDLDGKNVLYADWIDNSVDVVLYSDFDFEDKTGNTIVGEANCFYKTVTLMGGSHDDYDVTGITIKPLTSGLLRLGWWYDDPDSGWRQVENVNEFRNEDTRVQATVKLFAMWVEEIKVHLTTLNGSATYDFGGTAKGGSVAGAKSTEIFNAAQMTKEMVGVYKICKGDGSATDALEYGKEFPITLDDGGSFTANNLTSFNGLFYGNDKYGGVVVTVRFKDASGHELVSTQWSAIVSFNEYTVNVYKRDGSLLGSVKVRLDYEHDADDNAAYVRDILNGSEFFGFSGFTLPAEEGYTAGRWGVDMDAKITGALEIHPKYTAQKYAVRFESTNPVSTWEQDENGLYYYETEMFYDSVIRITATSTTEQTVGLENVIRLPDEINSGKREGTWAEPVINENGATFTVTYPPDKVTYHSEVPFTFEGVAGDAAAQREAEFNEQRYTLLTPVAAGYTFLGWFRDDGDGKWSKLTELTLGEEYTETTVEALWGTEKNEGFSATLETVRTIGQSKGVFGNTYDSSWRYESTLQIEGDCLVGAVAAVLSQNRTISVNHYLANDNEAKQLTVTNEPAISQENGVTEYKWDQTWSRNSSVGTSYQRSHAYAVITFTYHLDGLESDITFTVKVSDMSI